MSLSFGGQRQTQSQNTSLDGTTQAYLKQIMDAARGAGAAGPSPLVGGATDYYNTAMTGGNLGMGALSGDPRAAQQLMNPYQSQVIDANNAQWAKTNAATSAQVDDEATRAGAFGGSRHGVAEGIALGNNNQAQQQQTAGLLSTGYGDAMNRASQLAQMGYGAAGQNANLGLGGVGSPQQWLMQQLRAGFVMPTGQQSNGSSSMVGAQGGFNAGDAAKGAMKFFGLG